MMTLSRVTSSLNPHLSALPEKIVQFGSGRFLRAFADYFIDRANKQGVFNGRIVVVQSTGSERTDILNRQDGLYTLWVRDAKESYEVMGAISRSLSARKEWSSVLACACSGELELILSNTTEVGLTFDEEDRIDHNPPRSFPGKLTAFLYERARTFDYSPGAGIIILPCELLTANGDILLRLVLRMAKQWQLPAAFLQWVQEANTFCNTLVDRIVPGLPPPKECAAFERRTGYRDAMLTTAEEYRLWAIEGEEALRDRLKFVGSDPGIIVAPDIAPYRTRKIRILNGGHTLSVPMGFLMGNVTVLDNMRHPLTARFIEELLRKEIGPTLDVEPSSVPPYIDEVLERWRNPFLQHHLIDITLQSTSKMRVRALPSLLRYYELRGQTPHLMAAGFAAYMLFMRNTADENGRIVGKYQEQHYPIQDTWAHHVGEHWRTAPDEKALAESICRDRTLWGTDLTHLPGFSVEVAKYLRLMTHEGVAAAINHAFHSKGAHTEQD